MLLLRPFSWTAQGPAAVNLTEVYIPDLRGPPRSDLFSLWRADAMDLLEQGFRLSLCDLLRICGHAGEGGRGEGKMLRKLSMTSLAGAVSKDAERHCKPMEW